MYRVGLICEGPADRAIVEAILDAHLDDYESIAVQPPLGSHGGDSGPLGGGWKGVRTWCCQEDHAAALANADLLVVQVDADVAAEPEHALLQPCPPPSATGNKIRGLVGAWLGRPPPERMLLCVPAMASETWALVALFPTAPTVVPCEPAPRTGPCVECRADAKAELRHLARHLRPKLVVSQGGRLKNQASGYRRVQGSITSGWAQVVTTCGEAQRFELDLRAALQRR